MPELVFRNVRGPWKARQANGFEVDFTIIQERDTGVLSGSASTKGLSSRSCTGLVTTDSFVFRVIWNERSTGEYSGTFNPEGRITGITVDLKSPGNAAAWSSERTFERTGLPQ